MPARAIGELTAPEIGQRLGDSSILCLPVGALEQHGPHLPLNTDTVIAEEFARLAAERLAPALDLWILPSLSVSLSREHEWSPGTLSLSIEAFAASLRDLGNGIRRSLPTRNLMIVNGHGGNRGILEALIQDLRADCGLNVVVVHPMTVSGIDFDSAVPDVHGAKAETSLMLALAPQLVRRDKLAELANDTDPEAIRSLVLATGVSWPWSSGETEIAEHGVMGDAGSASAAFGEEILDRAVQATGAVLERLLARQALLRDELAPRLSIPDR